MDINNPPTITKTHIKKCFEAINRVHPKAKMKLKKDVLKVEIIHSVDFVVEFNTNWSFILKEKERKLPYKVEIVKRYDGMKETAIQGIYYDVVEIIMEVLVKHF